MNQKQEIFCFGSNLSGIHGAGAAKYARLHMEQSWAKALACKAPVMPYPQKG